MARLTVTTNFALAPPDNSFALKKTIPAEVPNQRSFYDEEEKESFPVCPLVLDDFFCGGEDDCRVPAYCSCEDAHLFCDNYVNPKKEYL